MRWHCCITCSYVIDTLECEGTSHCNHDKDSKDRDEHAALYNDRRTTITTTKAGSLVVTRDVAQIDDLPTGNVRWPARLACSRGGIAADALEAGRALFRRRLSASSATTQTRGSLTLAEEHIRNWSDITHLHQKEVPKWIPQRARLQRQRGSQLRPSWQIRWLGYGIWSTRHANVDMGMQPLQAYAYDTRDFFVTKRHF